MVSRQSKELWKLVLSEENEHRKEIVDQVITTELPESKNPEEVITAVQSFMESGLTTELMSLLEKIVLHNSDFSKYKKLQNLLIITAIRLEICRELKIMQKRSTNQMCGLNWDTPICPTEKLPMLWKHS